MKKKGEAMILTIISAVLIYFIFITWTTFKGSSSKQVKEAMNFLEKVESIGAIEGEVIPNAKEFKEVSSGNSTIKYTLVAKNYGVDLDQSYNVIGFSNQDISLAGTEDIDSEQAVKIAKGYLSKIIDDKVVFKEVKNVEDENNPFYTISFYKYYEDYINYSCEVILKINKYNGNLLAYSTVNNVSKDYNKNINITKEDAIKIVKNNFDKLESSGVVNDSVGCGYVYIDENTTQLCYLINYEISLENELGGIHQVYVSTNDGEIVKESIKSEVIGKVNE